VPPKKAPSPKPAPSVDPALALWLRHQTHPVDVLAEGQRPPCAGATGLVRARIVEVLAHVVADVLTVFDDQPGGDPRVGTHDRAWFERQAEALAVERAALAQAGLVSEFVGEQVELERELFVFPEPDELARQYGAAITSASERRFAELAAGGEVALALENVGLLEAPPGLALLETLAGFTARAFVTAAFAKQGGAKPGAALGRTFVSVVRAHSLPPVLGQEALRCAMLFAHRRRVAELTELCLEVAPLAASQPGLAFQLARAHAGKRHRESMLRFLRRACILGRDAFELDDPEFAPYHTDDDYRAILRAYPPTVEVFEEEHDDGS
jgi:hypothetical protein